jgi:hypothetical protein
MRGVRTAQALRVPLSIDSIWQECRGQDLNLRTAGERILSPPDLTALQPRQQAVVPPIVQEDYSSSVTISRPAGRGGATS